MSDLIVTVIVIGLFVLMISTTGDTKKQQERAKLRRKARKAYKEGLI